MSQEYKYDVAISFLQEDEQLAIEIADRIGDRVAVDVFVYSKRQNELVGKDGLEAFSGIFGEQSRVVVVLHRGQWGQTPWTRVEETAIKNRGIEGEQGWDFLLLIRLDMSAPIPKWLPRTRIWLGFDKYGINGAANAIETVVQQSGGEVRAETAVDYAGRIARRIDFKRERVSWYSSERGIAEATRESQLTFDELGRLAAQIQGKQTALGLAVARDTNNVVITCGTQSLVFGWNRGEVVNNLSGSYLYASLQSRLSSQNEIEFIRYDPDIDRSLVPGWRERDGEKKFLTGPQLADSWLRRLLDQTRPREMG
jgi:hypothetical protein